ncbi:hypothetical protein V2J09_021555 [Rumex salicifolius]
MSLGQRVNKVKSRLFVSPNVEHIAIELLGREMSLDLGVYLDITLFHKQVDRTTFDPLLQWINSRLSGWKDKHLSPVERITLARSVLNSLPVYAMATLSLPKGVCEKIDQTTRSFILGSWEGSRKIHLINWEEVSKPRDLRGLMSRECVNSILPSMPGGELWAEVLRAKYIRPSLVERSDISHMWRSIRQGVDQVVVPGSRWQVGNGRDIRFWKDLWDRPLMEWASGNVPGGELERWVCEYWGVGVGCNWTQFTHCLPSSVVLILAACVVSSDPFDQDQLAWKDSADGSFKVVSAYRGVDYEGGGSQS